MSIEQPLNNIQFTRSETPRTKKELWQKKIEEVDHIVDAVGEHIDAGIKNTVVAFDLLGLPTSASCEGHLDHGYCAPWVDVSAPGKPVRYIGEDGVYQRIAEKYGISVEDVQRGRNITAFNEFDEEASKNGETTEYKKWREENETLRGKADALLQEFYGNRTVSDNLRLVIKGIDAGDEFRVHNGGSDYETDHDNLNDEDKKQLAIRLGQYQKEMQDFTEFLSQKYFSPEKSQEGLLKKIAAEAEKTRNTPNYNEIRKKLEALDKKVLRAILLRLQEEFQQIGILDDLTEEGIDIFSREWGAPYPVDYCSSGSTDIPEGACGFWSSRECRIKLNDDYYTMKHGDSLVDNLASLASGQGFGARAEALIHETYHGFQSISPEKLSALNNELRVIQEEIRIKELEAKIQNKPAYAAAPLRLRADEIREKIRAIAGPRKDDTKEKLDERAIAEEVHSYMFSNPLAHMRHPSSTELSVDQLTELHDRYIAARLKGIQATGLYDFMEGKDELLIMAFRQIEALRALGLSNLEIGQIISEDEYDSEKNIIVNYKKKYLS